MGDQFADTLNDTAGQFRFGKAYIAVDACKDTLARYAEWHRNDPVLLVRNSQTFTCMYDASINLSTHSTITLFFRILAAVRETHHG